LASHLSNRDDERKGSVPENRLLERDLEGTPGYLHRLSTIEPGDRFSMPILLIVLLAILIGTVGFWDALGALLGAVVLLVLFWILVVVTVLIAAVWIMRKVF
jgi:uncharacterized membrane protein